MLALYNVYVAPYLLSTVDREDEGQGLVEYALILAFIAVACVVAVTALGGRINTLLGGINFTS